MNLSYIIKEQLPRQLLFYYIRYNLAWLLELLQCLLQVGDDILGILDTHR